MHPAELTPQAAIALLCSSGDVDLIREAQRRLEARAKAIRVRAWENLRGRKQADARYGERLRAGRLERQAKRLGEAILLYRK